VTQVMREKSWFLLLLPVLVLASLCSRGQETSAEPAGKTFSTSTAPQAPAALLYSQIRSVGLDASRVFLIRDASIDRDQLHITLADGTIAFTEDVNGRVTGAFFAGEGEILLSPPDQAERASMMLFTGAAILEEQFQTAYIRFNDDSFQDLQPQLRPFDQGKEFVATWNATAKNLAEPDALRLLLTFSRFLPEEKSTSHPQDELTAPASTLGDRYMHARIGSAKLGTMDAYFDSLAPDEISVAQEKQVEGYGYYDVLAAFSPKIARVGSFSLEKRPDEIAIESYAIDIDVRPPTQLSADAHLKVDVLQGGARAVLFELSRYLAIKKVEWAGRPVEFIQNQALEGTQLARRGNDVVAVVFPRALRAGEKLELTFSYAGDVLSDAGAGLLYVGARGIWYPNRGMAAADFDVRFQYPQGWILLATGRRVSENPEDSGTASQNKSRWVTERPIPVAGFNLGKYTKAVSKAGEATVETYAASSVEKSFPKARTETFDFTNTPPGRPHSSTITVEEPPPSPARNAKIVADAAARAVQFFAERFGPFPYSTLQLTQMPGPISQGWPGLIFLSSYAFLTPSEVSRLHVDKVNTILDKQVTAHETAHQWWGDLIFWRSYRDQWISEGLANYCSMMMLESESPAEFRVVMDKYRQDLLRTNKAGAVLKDAGPVTLGLRLSSSQFPDGYEAISYGRGTWLFHMLRTMLRDANAMLEEQRTQEIKHTTPEPFVRALLKVRERYAGKPISTRELIQVFAEELPPSLRYEGRRSLDWFYEGWINGTSIPRIELQGVKLAPKEKSVAVSGTITQKDAPRDLITSVPLYAVLPGDRRVLLGRVFADGPEASFRLSAPLGTRRVVADPEQTILSRPH